MRNQLMLFILLFLSIGSMSVPAQEAPKQISGGVLNGKAANLVKPAFPAAARAVKASGTVNVQVTIDENGNVISASAVSGHPLLRAAAVQAARASTFTPTTLSGQPVKVTGIIVYNFVSEMTFLQIGYEMSLAQRSPEISPNFPTGNISANLPSDWEDEKSDLTALSNYFFRKTTEAKVKEEIVSGRFGGSYEPSPNAAVKAPPKTISDPNEFLKELGGKIGNRLQNDELKGWYFRLGQILGSIHAEIEDGNKTAANIGELDKQLLNPPVGVSESAIAKAREISEFYRQSEMDAERRQQLSVLVRNLKDSSIGR